MAGADPLGSPARARAPARRSPGGRGTFARARARAVRGARVASGAADGARRSGRGDRSAEPSAKAERFRGQGVRANLWRVLARERTHRTKSAKPRAAEARARLGGWRVMPRNENKSELLRLRSSAPSWWDTEC